jgi:Flp pilus assembly protein TadG
MRPLLPSRPSGPRSDSPAPPARARRTIRRLRGDKRGAAALMTVIATTSLIGAAGLTVEVGNWYLMRRNMQLAADAAALAGSVDLDATKSPASAEAVARSVATRNGYVDGTDGATVAVDADDKSGNVTVTVQKLSTALLLAAAGYSNTTNKTIVALAVAQVVNAGSAPCVLALSGSVAVGNNVDINAGDCALASNSTAANAFKVGSGGSVANGSGHITVANIVTHGGCEGCAEAMGSKLTLTHSPIPTTYAPR